MGSWQEAGKAQPPITKENGTFAVATGVPGEGPVVSAGDLVKARVAVTTVDTFGSTKSNPGPQDVWVWTGRAPQRHQSSLWRISTRLALWAAREPEAL